MKLCKSCGLEKDDLEFHKRNASKDGLSAKCKHCQKEYDNSRLRDPKRMKARRDYQRTEVGKAAHGRACAKWIKKNPIKRAAHLIVSSAIKKGLLTKRPCEMCGCDVVNAHHDDYLKALDVRWLCDIHHAEWHSENGEGLNAT